MLQSWGLPQPCSYARAAETLGRKGLRWFLSSMARRQPGLQILAVQVRTAWLCSASRCPPANLSPCNHLCSFSS